MRVLVTGAAGFGGGHLVDCLATQGHEIVASDRRADFDVPAGVQRATLDVTDAQACWETLDDARPDLLFHLAGMAHVGQAEREPDACLAVNTDGTRNILAACLDGHANVKVVLASSAEVYGRVEPDQQPVTEAHPLRPGTLYGVSKACAEMHLQHAVQKGLHAIVARAFNHIGPRQSDDFVSSAFARQVALIEAGEQDPVLKVGNLQAVRDFSDVRQTVVGYLACAEVGQPGEVFNVTSGTGCSIQQLVDTLLELAAVPIRVEVDPARFRPLDVPVFHGSGAKLAERAGYRPELDLAKTLGDVLDDWRARLRDEAPRR